MSRVISQRMLRNQSGEIMRALDRGEAFIITRNGIAIGELRPIRRRFVTRSALEAVMADAPRIDGEQFRRDVDEVLDQRIEPTV